MPLTHIPLREDDTPTIFKYSNQMTTQTGKLGIVIYGQMIGHCREVNLLRKNARKYGSG